LTTVPADWHLVLSRHVSAYFERACVRIMELLLIITPWCVSVPVLPRRRGS